MIRFSVLTSMIRKSTRGLIKSAIGVILTAAMCAGIQLPAQDKPAANPAPDVLVLSNGDTLHGKFVSSMGGKVTFHSDPLGDVTVGWDKIKELHSSQKFAVLDDKAKAMGRKASTQVPVGTVEVENQTMTVHVDNAAVETFLTKSVEIVTDEATLDKQIHRSPGFFAGWNGAATAGATLVAATQNQYTVSGGIGLVRTVPTVSWLTPRDRTSFDFSGSFGQITQPGYLSGTTPVPAVVTKSEIYHGDAERDEYLSPRFFALGQVAFDHNYSQSLSLQQIYGGGFGWTALKTAKQEADLKGTAQYEKQQFSIGGAAANKNLIGSTFAASYLLHVKLFTYTQGIAYIPAYNDFRAYSANETNTFAFPAYKRLSFSVGTMDSYLNDPPVQAQPLTQPPTKRNSFQFTMGFTYAFKSTY
jgi:hypothetical protein